MRLLALVCAAAFAGATLASAASLSVTSAAVTSDEVGTCTATADRDTHVDELLSLVGAGSATDLQVKSQLAANQRVLVHFDLSACSIPASASVVSASLRLVLTTAPGASRTHLVSRVAGAWSEATTWSTKPTVAANATASAGTGTTAGASIAWDVVGDVRQWVSGSAVNDGLQIADETESAALPVDTAYAAREHATAASRPRLYVVWEQ